MTTQTLDLLNAQQVQTIADTVAEFNFFDNGKNSEYAEQERQSFVRWMNDPESYAFGGVFEYCNRFAGVRVHIALSADKTRVRYAHLSRDDSWATFTEEQVEAANARMAAVL